MTDDVVHSAHRLCCCNHSVGDEPTDGIDQQCIFDEPGKPPLLSDDRTIALAEAQNR